MSCLEPQDDRREDHAAAVGDGVLVLAIQVMARSAGTTSRTLRHDGKLGLLAPVAPKPAATATHENARNVTNTAVDSGSHPGLGERGRVASAGAGT